MQVHQLFIPCGLLPLILLSDKKSYQKWGLSATAAILALYFEYLLPIQESIPPVDSSQTITKLALNPTSIFLVTIIVHRLIKEHSQSLRRYENTTKELLDSEQVTRDSLAKIHSLMASLEDQKNRLDLALRASGIGIWEYEILFQEDNEVIAVQGAYQNITELKNAQKNESYPLTYLVIYSAS